MERLYEVRIGRPPGRPPTVDDPEHRTRRALALGMRLAGKSRDDIARELGVHRATLWRWERLDLARHRGRA
jgi:DNA invertase Pin-like site-specific DNA recombinase